MEEEDATATILSLPDVVADSDLSSDSELDMDYGDMVDITSPGMSDTPKITGDSEVLLLTEDWMRIQA
jgi:hypothetical protein